MSPMCGRIGVVSVALAVGAALSACGGASGDDRARGKSSATASAAARLAPGRTLAAAGQKCAVNAKLVPGCGAYWGIYSVQGKTLTSSVTDIEQRTGRRFDIVLRFHDFSTGPGPGRFPDASEQELGRSRLLFVAWESKLYQKQKPYQWRDIAAGIYDKSVIEPAAQRVRAYGKKIFMSFDPEMDRNMTKGDRKGNEAEYVAAARHVHDVFRRAGVRNVVWVWVITGAGGDNVQRILRSYPGDAYADWVGWDPYNFYKCHGTPWHTFDEKIGPTYRFLQRNGFAKKPFILPEYGTQYDPADPGRSLSWYRQIPGVLRHKYPNIAGLIRFDAGPGCNLNVDNGPSMLASYAQAGRDSYLNPSRP